MRYVPHVLSRYYFSYSDSECANHFHTFPKQSSTQKHFISARVSPLRYNRATFPSLIYSFAFAWQNYLLNIICKNLINICCLFFKRLARGLISHRGRHSFVTLLVTLAVTLSNQGRRTACGFQLRLERSRQDPSSPVCAFCPNIPSTVKELQQLRNVNAPHTQSHVQWKQKLTTSGACVCFYYCLLIIIIIFVIIIIIAAIVTGNGDWAALLRPFNLCLP